MAAEWSWRAGAGLFCTEEVFVDGVDFSFYVGEADVEFAVHSVEAGVKFAVHSVEADVEFAVHSVEAGVEFAVHSVEADVDGFDFAADFPSGDDNDDDSGERCDDIRVHVFRSPIKNNGQSIA